MDLFYKIQTTETPLQRSTILVVPYSKQEFLAKLASVTYTTNHECADLSCCWFYGSIGKDRFKISRRVTHSTTFLPILEGQIQESTRGCIIFLHYKLFNSIKQLLFFALFFVLCIAGYFFFVADEPTNTFLCFLFVSLNYAVAHTNFKKQVNITQQQLIKVIELN